MAIAQSGPAPDVRARLPKPGAEVLATLGGTLLAATLLVLAAMNVGPLWRDEVNTANLAQMPSAHDFWLNLSFESFPPLWPLLLRSGYALGWVDGDWTIRVMGLYVGFLFLGSLWLCIRWLGGRAPTLSVALLGCLPAFIFIVGANRAYGLGCCLLVLSFGTIWRLLECLSPARILLAGGACLLFAHCVYYDVILLVAMLAGGVLVALRRHQWKTLGVLAAMGLICAGSMAIYVPVVRRGSDYAVTIPSPAFSRRALVVWVRRCSNVPEQRRIGRIGLEPWRMGRAAAGRVGGGDGCPADRHIPPIAGRSTPSRLSASGRFGIVLRGEHGARNPWVNGLLFEDTIPHLELVLCRNIVPGLRGFRRITMAQTGPRYGRGERSASFSWWNDELGRPRGMERSAYPAEQRGFNCRRAQQQRVR